MKEIVFNKYNYECYKDFYTQIYSDLNGKGFLDWEDYENLNYSADMLNEFLWYNHNKNIKYIFIGLDLDKIKQEKTYDDYQWRLIIEVISDFVKEYPNNTMEIIKEEKQLELSNYFFSTIFDIWWR